MPSINVPVKPGSTAEVREMAESFSRFSFDVSKELERLATYLRDQMADSLARSGLSATQADSLASGVETRLIEMGTEVALIRMSAQKVVRALNDAKAAADRARGREGR